MGDSSLRSPTAWLNSAHVERWLRSIWPSWRTDDVRHDWDPQDRWYWIIPDYDRGRSRVLGMPQSLLERLTLSKLREVLDETDWRQRLEQEYLLVQRSQDGDWSVTAWEPKVDEKWFPDPRGGYFVAFQVANAVSFTLPPDAPPKPYLALHSKTWSAMGPEKPRPVQDYNVADLLPFLPENQRAAL